VAVLEHADNLPLHCPRCRCSIGVGLVCKNTSCRYAHEGFPCINHQPVLIDFDQSIFVRSAYKDGRGAVLKRDDSGRSLRTRVREFITGPNTMAQHNATRLLCHLKASENHVPTILIIGGGAIGHGVDVLFSSPHIRIVSVDVYASANTTLVADGHALPFPDEYFDAVWIQAVLEHVLDPNKVVAEIYRVLRPHGLIYAETPFMQQVHEGAYDFTRFTLSGHRWLFRRFDEIDSGPGPGAGTALVWSIRYFIRALTASDRLATLVAMPWFWLRLFNGRGRWAADTAIGAFFFGHKSEQTLHPQDMIAYYEHQGGHRPVGRAPADLPDLHGVARR
jgi:SAM-dependent methyltransferase